MSINHYSSETPQTALWWTQQHQPTTEAPPHTPFHPQLCNSINPCFNLNNQYPHESDDDEDDDQAATTTPQEGEGEEEEEEVNEEKETMFEKALTPSDVGKLNRLVIPKQHAEKYFPLGGGGDSGEGRGLLLSFEDESGKCWRFRYSYWNSSQSYVLTKGWSRYVKDKGLDAGDVVLFQRHGTHANRLFIGWRRRQPSSGSTVPAAHISRGGCHSKSSTTSSDTSKNGNGVGGGAGVPAGWTTGFYSAHPHPHPHPHPYPAHHRHHHPLPYQLHSLHAGVYPSLPLPLSIQFSF